MTFHIPRGQLLILKICGVVIAICLVILGIDRFFVRPGEPSESEQLAAAAAAMNMTLHERYDRAAELITLTRRFDGFIEPATEIGAVMTRKADDHELTLFEHRYEARALRTGTNSHDMGVELLGILLRLPGADLPLLGLRPGGQLAAPDEAAAREILTPDAVERMASFKGFTLVAAGEHVLFLSRSPASPLVAASQRSASPEFLPGLRNSGLKIDVQRAIDVTNRLALDRPAIASVYAPVGADIEVKVAVPKLDLGLDAQVEKTHREIDAIMEKHRQESAARRTEFEAKMKASREQLRGNLERHRTGSGADSGESPVPDDQDGRDVDDG